MKFNGVNISNISKINSISRSNIKKLNGVNLVESQEAAIARYLAETDFPSTTNLFGWRAGTGDKFTTIYGGVTLDDPIAAYSDCVDHLGNTVKGNAQTYNTYSMSSDGSTKPANYESFSFMCLFKNLVETPETLYFTGSDDGGENYSYFLVEGKNNNLMSYLLEGGDTIVQNTYNYTPDTEWHSMFITRDITNTVTKLYLDGVLADSDNIATSWTDYFSNTYTVFASSNIGEGTSTSCFTECWEQLGIVWTPEQIQSLHNVAFGG